MDGVHVTAATALRLMEVHSVLMDSLWGVSSRSPRGFPVLWRNPKVIALFCIGSSPVVICGDKTGWVWELLRFLPLWPAWRVGAGYTVRQAFCCVWDVYSVGRSRRYPAVRGLVLCSTYSHYKDIKQRKAADFHSCKAGTSRCLAFFDCNCNESNN